MSSVATSRQGIYQLAWVRRLACWLDAMPYAPVAIELAPDRVAAARKLDPGAVKRLVDDHIEGRQLGVLGEPRVNVLLLNLALEKAGGGK